jgi:hypothetical protein
MQRIIYKTVVKYLRKSKIISSLVLILIIGCKSQSGIKYSADNGLGFEYLNIKQSFDMKLVDFFQNTAHCGTEGLPYALLIGKTESEFVPENITVLSYCDNRIFKVGEKLKIEPTENPTEKTTMNLIYFVKDTIINGNKNRWLIGSEYKAIWGIPIKLNK